MKEFSKNELVSRYESLTQEQQVVITSQLIQQTELAESNVTSPKAAARNPDHRVIGKMFFEYDDNTGKPIPIHNLYLELWDRDTTNPDDFLGQCRTDHDGNFEIWYDPRDAGLNDLPDLDLRVYELRHKFDKHGNIKNRRKLVYTISGEDNVTSKTLDFGVCRIPLWEYDPGTLTPRVLIADEGTAPESYGPGRSLVMVKVLADIELKKRKHLLQVKLDINKLKIETVQKDYPENITRILEEKAAGSTRSDEYFGNMILNGMASSILDRDPENPGRFWVHFHWNSYEQDGVYAMPNIDIYLEPSANSIVPVEIIVSLREKGATAANASLTKYSVAKDDGDKWLQAKRIARVSATLSAELNNHLSQTHLNIEQYSIAARRNLRLNPIRHLLLPHVKEVALINHSANSLLLGPTGYITRSTAFTAESIGEYIQQVVATLDWKGWQPRRVVCEDHKFAKASLLFWQVLGEYVDWYFSFYDEDIRKYWLEIKEFSDTLVRKSTDFFLCGYLRGHIEPNESEEYWFDWNERAKLSSPREVIDGKEKSLSAITHSAYADQEGLDNLKQLCKYVIQHATFMHWWSNSKQYDEGGELRFNALGLRYGDTGLFTGEEDDSVLPPPEDATMQLWISYMLTKTNFGLILKNEEQDIHPQLIEILKKYSAEFEELGVDISKIPSRTNI
jgi:lipoxygenase